MAGCVLAAAWGHGDEPRVTVWLSAGDPSRSHAEVVGTDGARTRFPVGSGRHGILPEGAVFRDGWSLLGRFRVNLVLDRDGRCEMTPELRAEAGRSGEELRRDLFAGMNGLDFDGDGKTGEYGEGYIGLEAAGTGTEQPFRFGFYGGVFRRYSYALHGTEDEGRIGRQSTGGCINFTRADLGRVLAAVTVGDVVEVRLLPEEEEKSSGLAIPP